VRRVLITGATGFVGGQLLTLLKHDQGWDITATARLPDQIASDGISTVVVPDLNGATDWFVALSGVETVVHCAAQAQLGVHAGDALAVCRRTNTYATCRLASQAIGAGVRRFVYISTAKVHGESGRFHEADVFSPQDPYGISKLEAEQGLWELTQGSDMEVVIIRPPLVYGPGVKGNFATLVHWVRQGYPLPFGAVDNQRSFVALENLVDFIALCADRTRSPCAANQVFLISDGVDVSTPELLRKVAQAYGVPFRLWPVPEVWLRLAARLLGKSAAADRLLGSLVVDSSKACDFLGWRPVVTMEDQLRKMALHDQGV